MRILQVTSTLDPSYGGPVEGLKQMSSALINLGHEVDIFTFDHPNCSWLINFPINFFALSSKTFFNYKFNSGYISWLKNNAHLYDVVIINGIWQFPSIATWYALRRSNVPYFLYPHGMLDPWFKGAYPLKHIKKWVYWTLFERNVLSDARLVLFTTEDEFMLAKESFWLFSCNGVIANFGIYGFRGDAKASSQSFYSLRPDLVGKKIILFLSRLHKKKGCDLLIKAFSLVCKNDADMHLLFIGPDQDGWRVELEGLTQSLGVDMQVTWLGMVEDDIKWGAFNSADVFALPSHSENFGAVVPEALSCGLPVLISNKINIHKKITDYGGGFVCQDDEDGAATLLKQWRELSESSKAAMRVNARSCFLANFEISSSAQKLSKIITDAIN